MPKRKTILPEEKILSEQPRLMNFAEKNFPVLVEKRSAPRERLKDIGKEVGANFRSTEFQADIASYTIAQIIVQSVVSGVQPALRRSVSKALKRER